MTPSLLSRWTRFLSLLLVAGSLLTGCGYNEFQTKDEATKAAWSTVSRTAPATCGAQRSE